MEMAYLYDYCFVFFSQVELKIVCCLFLRDIRLGRYLVYIYIIILYIGTDNIMLLLYCVHVYYSIFPRGKFTLNCDPLFSYTILNSCLHRGGLMYYPPPLYHHSLLLYV